MHVIIISCHQVLLCNILKLVIHGYLVIVVTTPCFSTFCHPYIFAIWYKIFNLLLVYIYMYTVEPV